LQRSLTANMLLTATYSGSAGKFLPGAGPGGETVNIAPLKYLPLGSLLTATATPATIAQAAAVFPGVGLPFPQFCGNGRPDVPSLPAVRHDQQPVGRPRDVNLPRSSDVTDPPLRQWIYLLAGLHVQQGVGHLLGTPRNPFNAALEKAPGTINRTHVFTGTYVYALPFGAGRPMNRATPSRAH